MVAINRKSIHKKIKMAQKLQQITTPPHPLTINLMLKSVNLILFHGSKLSILHFHDIQLHLSLYKLPIIHFSKKCANFTFLMLKNTHMIFICFINLAIILFSAMKYAYFEIFSQYKFEIFTLFMLKSAL